jgi:hypothetical protein
MNKKFLLAVFISSASIVIWAQPNHDNDLLSLLGDDNPVMYATATFKSTRVINGQSIENVGAGDLDFRVSHRFGTFNSGIHKMFGLDIASMRLGFEYGVNDRVMVGLGRSNVNEEVDAFTKIKLLRQIESGPKKMPISVSYFASMVMRGTEWSDPSRDNYFTSRLYYCHQLLIARKFSDKFSLQVTPTFVHRNLVQTSSDYHDIYAIGYGGRYKVTRRLAINGEYFQLIGNRLPATVQNSASIGVDLETGGHVFQLHVTNSASMNEKGFITETNGQWGKGDIQFGFNISRVFTIREKKKIKD